MQNRIYTAFHFHNSTRITKIPNLNTDRIFDRYFSEEDARQAPHTSLVPALGSQGGFCSFKLSLGYIIKPCLKRKRRKGEGEEGREGGKERGRRGSLEHSMPTEVG